MPSKMLRNSISMIALAATGALAAQAHAAEVVVPSGVTVAQQTLNDGDALTVNSGGAVSDAATAVQTLAAPVTAAILNKGTIESTAGDAIDGATMLSSLGVINSGLISGFSSGLLAGTLDLNNSGTILAGFNDAVGASTINSLTNSGDILANGYGVTAGIIFSLANSGTIGGDGGGVKADILQSLANSGTITSQNTAVLAIDINSLVNGGTIEGIAGDGVNASGTLGYFDNSGTVLGFDNGVRADNIFLLINRWAISGDSDGVHADTSLTTLSNSGVIRGRFSDGVYAGVSIGTVTNGATGIISGDVNGVWAFDGDIAVLDNYGTIGGFQDAGVNADAIGSLFNAGTIIGGERGVMTDTAGIDSIVNSGVIRGILLDGIAVSGNIGSLLNEETGQIIGDQYGVTANEIAVLNNKGIIHGGTSGIYKLTGGATSLTNSGAITGGSSDAVAGGGIFNLVNSGTIVSNLGDGLSFDEATVTNSGMIGGHAAGIYSDRIVSLTNSGLIRGATVGDYAIHEGLLGVDTVLSLDAGSILIGRVDISAGNDTLNVGKGLNLALTFDGSLPETINTFGAPYFIDGLTVNVADPSSVVPDVGATADLAGSIAGAVGNAIDPGLDELGAGDGRHYFLEAVGGVGETPGSGGGSDLSHRYGGVVAGLGFMPDAGTRTGFFLGAAAGRSQAESNQTDTSSFYGGVYASRQMPGYRLDGVLTAGYGNGDGARVIADNTSPTGLVTAASARDAFFLAPSLTVSKPFTFGQAALRSSFTVAYTGIFSRGFSETGGPAPLSVDGGATHVLEAKALVSLPNETTTEAGVVQADIHGGIETRAVFQPGGLSGSFGATPFTLSDPDTRVTAGFTAGSGLRMKRGAMTFFANADAVIRTDSSYGLTGRLGLKGAF